jgi:isopentenyl-diphosphate delta-isomerase
MEYIMVYGEDGEPLFLKERGLVHRDGDLHHSIQCWIINGDNEVLLQRRAKADGQSFGKWDVSFGGHCVNGEGPEETVLREGKEELDIDINAKDLIFLSTFRYSSQEGKNQEVIYIYAYRLDFDVRSISFQESEISSLKKISVHDLRELFLHNDRSLASRKGAMKALFEYTGI